MKTRGINLCSDTLSDDASLWKSFKNGDKDVFAHLYSDHIDLLSNYGLRFTHDREMVQDAIHDMFVDLWRNRTHLSDTDNISKYLLKALRNNLLKKINKVKKIHESSFLSKGADFENVISPEKNWILNEFHLEVKNHLNQEMHKLPARQKEALYLKLYVGLDYKATAQVMNLNQQSVYNLVFKGIKNLRKKLSRDLIFYLLTIVAFFLF